MTTKQWINRGINGVREEKLFIMNKGNSKRFKVLMRDGFKCRYCGKTASDSELEVDHIIPRSKGGNNDLINLITSCFECNRGKRDKSLIKSVASIEVSDQEKLAIEAFKKQSQEDNHAMVFTLYFLDKCPHEHDLNGHEKRMFKDYSKKFSSEILLEAIGIAIESYIPEMATKKDYYKAIKKIGGISHNITMERF